MKGAAEGRLVVGTKDSDWTLKLSLDKRSKLLDRSCSLVFPLQGVDKMHSGKVVQEMQHPAVAVVPPCELLQVKMDACKRLQGTRRRVS